MQYGRAGYRADDDRRRLERSPWPRLLGHALQLCGQMDTCSVMFSDRVKAGVKG